MRDLTNAVVRFSWIIPLFGMKQMLDLVTCRSSTGQGTAEIVDALNDVSDTARRHLGDSLEEVSNAWSDVHATVSDTVFRRGSGSER
jgi:hypothetical protein